MDIEFSRAEWDTIIDALELSAIDNVEFADALARKARVKNRFHIKTELRARDRKVAIVKRIKDKIGWVADDDHPDRDHRMLTKEEFNRWVNS